MGKNKRRNQNAAPWHAAAASNPNVAWRPKEQRAEVHDGPSIEKLAAEFVKAVTSEVTRLKHELHASEQANTRLQADFDELAQKAADDSKQLRHLSEQVAAIQSEKDELELQLAEALARPSGAKSSHLSHRASFCGVEWCFECHPGEWTSLPADRSADLQKHYQEFLGGGDAVIRMRSGVEEYTFDFSTMYQTNTRTRTSRAIKGQLHAPSNWTRYVSLERISKTMEMESFELIGFESAASHPIDGFDFNVSHFNGTYVLSSFHTLGGHHCWWHVLGHVVIYKVDSCLFMMEVNSHYDASCIAKINGGLRIGYAQCSDASHLSQATKGWKVMTAAQTWEDCSAVQIAAPRPSAKPPLMEVAVELLDAATLRSFEQLLRDSAVHATHHHGASLCNHFKTNAKVVRILQIENWHLWSKYRNHLEQVKGDLSTLGVVVEAVEPALPAALGNLPAQCGVLDDGCGEHLLFHGTDYETAVKIALGGFDFRLSKPGFYGQGTYFASQACKSHQYTQNFRNLHTIIVSRVVLGDVFYATKVDKELKRPPPRAGSSRCCDTVVAKPGPMPGHQHGEQTHQEFVIFDKFQAYPEFLVQYSCEA